MINQLQSTVQLVKAGAWGEIRRVIRLYWRSNAESVGLRRDITVPFPMPQAAVPITVRPLKESDVPILFANNGEPLSGEAMLHRGIRRRMLKASIATCYVAVNDTDQPCYVQWLIGPSDNPKVRALFGDRFPWLEADEMLLEGAFTLEAWRGKGIMAAAMAQIAEKAADHGARWVITVVASDNIPSLKGCKKCGFEPYLGRTDRWRRFRFQSNFVPLPSTAD